MHIVVPYTGNVSWPLQGNRILLHYQILAYNKAIVYFPSTHGCNVLTNVPPDMLEEVIREYVQYSVIALLGDEKSCEVLQLLFVDDPNFDIRYVETLYTGWVTIDVPSREVSP